MMKKHLKKIAAMAMAASIMAGAMYPTTALAANKNVRGYGTLTGTLTGTKAKGTAKTIVAKNPDNANLTLSVDFKKSAGGNVIETKSKTGRGGKLIQMDWKNMPSRVGCAYGAHGVQGGRQYPAYVVYTYTTLK